MFVKMIYYNLLTILSALMLCVDIGQYGFNYNITPTTRYKIDQKDWCVQSQSANPQIRIVNSKNIIWSLNFDMDVDSAGQYYILGEWRLLELDVKIPYINHFQSRLMIGDIFDRNQW